jgi:hypothetical protein
VTQPECAECARPVGDNAPLCTRCGQRTIDALLSVPALLDEFAITRAGLARMNTRVGGAGADTTLPVKMTTGRGVVLEGDRGYHRLINTVTTWCRVVAEDLGCDPYIGGLWLIELTDARRADLSELALRAINKGAQRAERAEPAIPSGATAQAAVWLAHHRHQLRAHEAAPELLRDITAAVAAVTRYIDRPVERRNLGACSATPDDGERCGHPLWSELDDSGKTATYVYCGRCKARYEVARIEADARAIAEEYAYTLGDLVRVTAAIGAPIPKATLYRWAKERRIESHGWQHVDALGVRITDHQIGESDVRVYRLGDALELAKREPRRGRAA